MNVDPNSFYNHGNVKLIDLLVIIVNYNSGDDLANCVKSVKNQNIDSFVVVIDNVSSDGSLSKLNNIFPDVSVQVMPSNVGFGAAINFAVSKFPANYIVILNPDIELQTGCIKSMLNTLNEKPGVVGPILNVLASNEVEGGMTINHAGMPTSNLRNEKPLYIQGCVMATTLEVFRTVQGFDERYFLFVEDVEFCWRALIAGFEVSVEKTARAVHRGGGSIEGGYLVNGERYVTNKLRISLRERNDVALMLSCSSLWWLACQIPLMLIRVVVLFFASFVIGKPSVASDLIRGVLWNVKNFKGTLARRKSVVRTSSGIKNASSRIHYGPLMHKAVLGHGIPKIN